MKDRAGESLRKALKVNVRRGNQRVKDFIGSRDDTIDIFRFRSSSSTISITTKGLGRKEDLTLYQVDQKLGRTLKRIGKRDFGELRPRQQQKFLSALDLSQSSQGKSTTYSTEVGDGVYFLVASSTAPKSSRYTLRFSATPLETAPSSDNGGIDSGMNDGTTGDGTSDDATSGGGPSGGTDDSTGGTTGGTSEGTDGTDDSAGSTEGNTGGADGGGGGTPNSGSANTNDSWTRQLGSNLNDYGYGIAVDNAGNIYIAGTTAGALAGTNGGQQDNFVTKYDAIGQELWTRQFNVDDSNPGALDTIFDIAVDSAGNYYVVGTTINLPADFSPTSIDDIEAIDADGFIAKYDPSGNKLWSQVIETAADTRRSTLIESFLGSVEVDIHKFDAASSVAIAPDGAVYVGGFVEAIPMATTTIFGQSITIEENPSQGFIAKFDSATGDQNWLTPLGGNASDAVTDLAIDNNGRIHITGIKDATLATLDITSSNLAAALDEPFIGGDAWVAQYEENSNASGAIERWSQTLASVEGQQVYGRGIALDASGNVYITGDTTGTLPTQTAAGERDGFVAKYDASGIQQWRQQFGTDAGEQSQAIAIDSTGKIYITGETAGSLYGPNVGSNDIWIATYDPNGNLTASNQFGTTNAEEPYRITVDSNDNVYAVGQTLGDLASTGANQGLTDVVTLKNPVVHNT
ncbi:MAG: hypothetical protein F6K30_28210 [Cyanothece sp. SIO2G6]|nr:hypothetical protein [Cyanothece sp. SIO2G6]